MQNKKNQFEKYRLQIKETIQSLIEKGDYETALQLLSEYEVVVGHDEDSFSMRVALTYFQGDVDEAENLCKSALNQFPDNFDSLYNLAHIFQEKGYYEGAVYFYKRSLQVVADQELEEIVKRNLVEAQEQLDVLNQRRYATPGIKKVHVTIAILAYNQLEYTKLCVDSFYRFSSHHDFELLTVDNGSSDGTKQYFEWLPNRKKVYFDQNQGCVGASSKAFPQAEGEYIAFVSNDLVLTENWLDNLLTCFKSDEKIGIVVPACSASSGFQQVDLGYANLVEMQQAAKSYNQSNRFEWEERIRLITYSYVMKTDFYLKYGLGNPAYKQGGFDDDDLSFVIRRAGYKLIFAKDTFVHHFGSKTITQDYQKHNLLLRNRSIFFNFFGVDAWDDTGFNGEVFSILKLPNKISKIKILEIGNSCGGNALHLKNLLRKQGILEVGISYLTDKDCFLSDLKTLGNQVYCEAFNQVGQLFQGEKFDYILINGELENMVDGEKNLSSFLFQVGSLMHMETQTIFYIGNPAYYMNLFTGASGKGATDNARVIWENIDRDRFDGILQRIGFEEICSYNLTMGVSGQHQELCNDMSNLFQKYIPNCDGERFRICKFLYTIKGFYPKKKFLVYPGYDVWLNNVLLRDKSIGNFLGVDVGENAIELLKRELHNIGYCLDTIDQVPLNEADYILYFDVPKSFENPVFSPMYHQVYKGKHYFDQIRKQAKRPVMLLLLWESPLIMPENYCKEMHEKFDYIFTWHDDLVDNKKYFKLQFAQPEKVNNPYIQLYENKKLCTLVAGNKSSQEEGELYSQRLNVIEFFEKNHSGKFDFYGTGWPERVYKNYKGTAAGKLSVMSQYRFAICYENNVMNGYITEKIFDCFFARCVPVYWGAPNITDFIPDNTFIDRQQFATNEEMYKYLNAMTEKEYKRYINNIENFLSSEQYKQFTYQAHVQTIMRTIGLKEREK